MAVKSRATLADVMSSAKDQAAATTGLPQPAPAPVAPRAHLHPVPINEANEVMARIDQIMARGPETRMGLFVPATTSEERRKQVGARMPEWLYNAAKIRAAEMGLTIQDFYMAAVYKMIEETSHLYPRAQAPQA